MCEGMAKSQDAVTALTLALQPKTSIFNVDRKRMTQMMEKGTDMMQIWEVQSNLTAGESIETSNGVPKPAIYSTKCFYCQWRWSAAMGCQLQQKGENEKIFTYTLERKVQGKFCRLISPHIRVVTISYCFSAVC